MSKGNTRRKKCDLRLSFAGMNHVFQKKLHGEWSELLRKGLVPARVWRGQPADIAHREEEVGEASGSTIRQEGVGFAFSFHGSE